MPWLLAAVLSACLAGSTSILAKCGVRKTDSDVATALRTVVVLLFAWIVVFATGLHRSLADISTKSLVFLLLSGLATGTSWIFNFKALSLSNVNKVDPVDKASTLLTVLFAITVFRETENLVLKLTGTFLLAMGIVFMVEKKKEEETGGGKLWLFYAVLSAVFASLTSVFAKVGLGDVPSNLANAIRAAVVLFMAWGIVLGRGKQKEVARVTKKDLVFIVLSGITTAASWLFYYYAIQKGVVSVVVPVDKMSIVIAILFSRIFLKEPLSKKAFFGLLFITLGTLLLAVGS